MKTLVSTRHSIRKSNAFTLIEMIGVLAVIAILAAVLIPKVFDAINNARINNAAMSLRTVKTAVADHYQKVGVLDADGSVTPPAALAYTSDRYIGYDDVLVKEQVLDKILATKIATNSYVELYDCSATNVFNSSATVGDDDTTGFALSGGTTNTVVGNVEVIGVLQGVMERDAKDLNDLMDGPALGEPLGTADDSGRVKYAATSQPNDLTDVYVYITHR